MALGLGLGLSFGTYGGGGGTAIQPPPSTNQVAWYLFNTGITVTGSGVSTWADQSGNGRDLLQGTDTNRPAKQGDGSILFDGVDNFLKTATFTTSTAFTIYLLARQVVWTSGSYIFDGNTPNTAAMGQFTSTPRIQLYAGSFGALNDNWTVNTYSALAIVFNGAGSVIQVNNSTSAPASPGGGGLSGFTLGASGAGGGQYSNIQVKEVIIYNVAHNSAQIAAVIAYLNTV